MDSRMKPFTSVEPCGSNPVVSAEWSGDGQGVLVAGGGWGAVVWGRDGGEEG